MIKNLKTLIRTPPQPQFRIFDQDFDWRKEDENGGKEGVEIVDGREEGWEVEGRGKKEEKGRKNERREGDSLV